MFPCQLLLIADEGVFVLEKTFCKCPYCGKRHRFYGLSDLAEQFDVSYHHLYQQIPNVDVIRVGRNYRIPECQIAGLFELQPSVV
jgi:predicted glycosyltransferase involved in capsule biosynthesis